MTATMPWPHEDMAGPRKPDALRRMLRIRLSTEEYVAIRSRGGALRSGVRAGYPPRAPPPVTRFRSTPLKELIMQSRHEPEPAHE